MQNLSEYTPKNLVDAINALERACHPDGLETFSNVPEAHLKKYLPSLGRTISTEWRLGLGSYLDLYFKQQGITDSEQIVKIIILMLHRKINNEPCSLETVKKDIVGIFK